MKKIIKILLVSVSLVVGIVLFTHQIKTPSIPSVLSKTNALDVVYKLTGTKNCTITSLKGGLSESMLYKVDSNNKSYVIRLIGHRSMKDRLREVGAQTIASEEGWGPTVYASDSNEGWVVMDYIKPTHFTEADRADEEMYRTLGRCLQQIHSGQDFLPGKPRLKQIEEKLYQLKERDKIPQSINYLILKNIMELVKKNHSTILAPTHGDLNPNNILFSHNRPFIIDFESAGQDDPFYDLGTIGIFYIFHPHHEKVYLDAYFNRPPTPQEYAHYKEMKLAALLFYGLNFLDLIPQKIIKNVSVSIEPFEKMLDAVTDGTINIADPTDQLKLAVSILQEAINQYANMVKISLIAS